ncbi:MAG TPA: glycoside hydrolase domain-containing protein [Streptosporangiaceae bacterium]|nr:glycoside hydrolase domain-containing protein [Streptosporangiaceae bacterium]
MAFGIDYSYGSGLSVNRMKAAGVTFVCRYLAWLPNSKCINKTEFQNLIAGGMHVVFVWEGTGRDLVNGFRGGQHDAQEASRQVAAMGAPGCPIYFAPADYDVPPGDQGMYNSYLDGVASTIGRPRTGAYGGYWPLSRAFAAGKCHYAWQTYAWSGGNLIKGVHLYQYQNGARMGPAEVDYDRSYAADCGWWPRPRAAAPAKPAPAAPVAHKAGEPYAHDAGGRTLTRIASDRGTTVEHLLTVPGNVALLASLTIPAGKHFFTTNP